jgi:hypothetical protein
LKKLLIFPALFFILQAQSQSAWKQTLRYEIHIKFIPSDKSADALMKLQYINRSPDTLTYMWFHVWPNAYRNDRTPYSEQLLQNGDTRYYFSSRDQKGYLNRLDFRVNGILAQMQDHPEYMDVEKLLLPQPLLPGDSITVSASFHLRIPYNFNGNGYGPHHVEMRNWYPEPAVYDQSGWHPMPFLVQGGAYHENADFRVEIEAPPAYRIAAGAVADTLSSSPSNNLYRFSIRNANSFAWIADNRFRLKTDTLQTGTGEKITLQYFYLNDVNGNNILFSTVKKNIRQLSAWLSPYPHQTLSIVQCSQMEGQDFSGILCIGGKAVRPETESAIRKELLGQWFQTILMTDQRTQPWLSRGFMDYYDKRLLRQFPPVYPDRIPYPTDILWLRVAENEKKTQPIITPAPEFSTRNDSLIAETKTGLWISRLQDSIGSGLFDQTMLNYFSGWKFDHPQPADFKMMMEKAGGKNSGNLWNELNSVSSLSPPIGHRTLKPAFIFSARNSERYNYIGLAPAVGYNKYDEFMLGAVIHNINLPANKFEFLFTPLYAFGSKELVGLGRMGYTWHPDTKLSRISIGINGAYFNTNKATDSNGRYIYENFSKLVPYIRVDFKPADPRSTISKWIDFKTYLITQKNYKIESYAVSPNDSLIHPNALVSNFYYVNQLSFNLQDNRVLYPYDLRVEFQQSELFYRINLHADYFLNYPDGGGLQVRFFAAKFGAWNNDNSLALDRFEPQLLGVTGEEDYLYENYFIGRSATYAQEKTSVPNQGLAAQQIMNRDGGLKLRIDDLTYLQGKSANWVSSLNFCSTLPAHLFPFPVPIRIFFDVGTYAEAWKDNSPTSRFLYTGGIQLSLFKNVLNIYAPLIYSSDFTQALNSLDFGRKITFSIDLQRIDYKWILKKRLPVYE